MTDWRQAELRALWFARVASGMQLLIEQPHLTWQDVADRYRCGYSTLGTWRKRYWQAQQDGGSQGEMSGNEQANIR